MLGGAMKAKIRGTEIYFDVAGTQIMPTDKNGLVEKPVLFLIHGGPGGNHVRFKIHSIDLQEYAQLIFIDQRGCGFSKKTKASDYTLKNNIEDIEALRKHLGLKKISILGVSYGGMVAQGYAIKYAKNLDKLILVVTAPSYHFVNEAKANLEKVGTKKQIDVCNKFLWSGKFKSNKDVEHYFQVMESLYFYKKPKKHNAYTARKVNELDKYNVTSYEVLNAGVGVFLKKFNFIPKLHKITCPTLILAGKHDWICSPNQSKIMAKEIKGSILKIFPNCGHAIASDANKAYLKAVSNFIKKK